MQSAIRNPLFGSWSALREPSTTIFILGVILRLLLAFSYRSTDFEVHRHWLSITHELPIREWYRVEISNWTLDYPPAFAIFEYVLSQIAWFVDKRMLELNAFNYASSATIYFQRSSVIISEFVLWYAISQLAWMAATKQVQEDELITNRTDQETVIGYQYRLTLTSCIFHPCLIFVDHIHFQYNGFVLGVFLLSMVYLVQGKTQTSILCFAISLNLKHILVYFMPMYLAIVVSCEMGAIRASSGRRASLFYSLMAFTLPFVVFWSPFVYMGQVDQLLGRLFPFQRGLLHSFWAPNFWAMLAAVDKVLVFLASRMFKFDLESGEQASMTSSSGRVGIITPFLIMPNPTPKHCAILVLCSMLPCAFMICRFILVTHGMQHNNQESWLGSLRSIRLILLGMVHCSSCAFVFGYHVHEKAILMVILPLCAIGWTSREIRKQYLFVSVVSSYFLFPLLFTPSEYRFKLGYSAWYFLLMWEFGRHRERESELQDWEAAYLIGIPFLEIYNHWIHPMVFGIDKLEFLPLLLVSAYCAIGVLHFHVRCMKIIVEEYR